MIPRSCLRSISAGAALLLACMQVACGGGGDGGGGAPPPAQFTITTYVLPEAFTAQSYDVTLQVSGGRPPYTWRMATGSGPLPDGLSLSLDGTIYGTPSRAATFDFTVYVQDSTSRSATRGFTVFVRETFRISTDSLPTGIRGQFYSATLQGAGGTPPYAWSLAPNSSALPVGINLATDGTLSGTPAGPTCYTVNFRLQDSTSASTMKSFPLCIYDVLRVGPTSLPKGNVGISWSYHLYAIGGSGGYSWSLAPGSGPLPPGMTLNPTGTLNGTPSAPGTYPIVLQVRDNAQPPQTATQSLSILVENRVIIVGPQPVQGVVGRNYQHALNAVGGVLPYTWSVAPTRPLPAGLALDSVTGVISGMPTADTYASVEFLVADSSSPPQTHSYVTYIAIAPPLSLVTARLKDGVLNGGYFDQGLIGGGLSPYQVRLAAGSLPPGLTLSLPSYSNWFWIDGTTTSLGTFNFTIEATDSSSPPYVATKDYSITINTAVQLNYAGFLPEGLEGTPYTATFSASGGVPPYRWEVVTGPRGLTIDAASGVLSGTPIEPFSQSVGIRLLDSSYPPQDVTRYFPLRIIERLKMTSLLPPIMRNVPMRLNLGAAGGVPSYNWTLVSGTMPPGLTFNAFTAEISGTPTELGSWTFTVRVADSGASFPQSLQTDLTLSVQDSIGRNDSPATSTPLSNGTYRASISPVDDGFGNTVPDTDYYAVTAKAGALVSVEIIAERLNPSSPMDSVIEFVNTAGGRMTYCSTDAAGYSPSVCMNDDDYSSGTLDSKLYIRPYGPTGSTVTFYVRVLDWSGMARPDFRYEIRIVGTN
jgi:hypothetical protein